MDADTVRTVNDILSNGWYGKGTIMGEGGWGKIPNWNKYILESVDSKLHDEIHAKDDETAQKAFHSLHNFDRIEEWDIFQVVTNYRLINSSLQKIDDKKEIE